MPEASNYVAYNDWLVLPGTRRVDESSPKKHLDNPAPKRQKLDHAQPSTTKPHPLNPRAANTLLKFISKSKVSDETTIRSFLTKYKKYKGVEKLLDDLKLDDTVKIVTLKALLRIYNQGRPVITSKDVSSKSVRIIQCPSREGWNKVQGQSSKTPVTSSSNLGKRPASSMEEPAEPKTTTTSSIQPREIIKPHPVRGGGSKDTVQSSTITRTLPTKDKQKPVDTAHDNSDRSQVTPKTVPPKIDRLKATVGIEKKASASNTSASGSPNINHPKQTVKVEKNGPTVSPKTNPSKTAITTEKNATVSNISTSDPNKRKWTDAEESDPSVDDGIKPDDSATESHHKRAKLHHAQEATAPEPILPNPDVAGGLKKEKAGKLEDRYTPTHGKEPGVKEPVHPVVAKESLRRNENVVNESKKPKTKEPENRSKPTTTTKKPKTDSTILSATDGPKSRGKKRDAQELEDSDEEEVVDPKKRRKNPSTSNAAPYRLPRTQNAPSAPQRRSAPDMKTFMQQNGVMGRRGAVISSLADELAEQDRLTAERKERERQERRERRERKKKLRS